MKRFILTWIMSCMIVWAFAQTPAATGPVLVEKVTANPGELKIAYEKWLLPNGLTIYVHEDHSDPIVHVEVTYHVGSARETPGKSGFAHFFEHMMFQGSENVADEEHFKIVEGAGGDMNGTTNRDRTNYFETLPKNYLETALWLEADRMGFILDSVTQKKFEVQRSTVKNEKDQRITNAPYGRVDEIKGQILYPQNHPYNWPIIGYVEDLDRVDVEDLKNFFMRWYGPNNASLVVSGDVNPTEVINLAMKYFGPIPRGPEVKKQRVEPVRLPDNVYANYGDNIVLPMTYMVFPSVPEYHPDEPALEILGTILGQGNNSVLYQQLVKTEKVFQAFSFNLTSELAGEFTFQILSYPAFMQDQNDKTSTDELVRNALLEFEKTGATDEDIARAIGAIETQFIAAMQSIGGKSSILSQWHYVLPNKSMNLTEDLARYKKVTKDDVMRVYRQYIKGKYAAIVNVFAKEKDATSTKEETKLATSSGKASSELEYKGLSYKRPTDNFDRSKRPEIKGTVTPVVPTVYKSSFENGMKIIGTQNSELPLVTFILNLRGGNIVMNDPNKSGLASLTAAMMEESTENYTAEQFSSEMSKIGSSISFSAARDYTMVFVTCQKKNLDRTLQLLEEKLLKPKFTSDAFRLNQKQLAEQINSMRVQAGDLAGKAYARLLYGKSILAEPTIGTIKSIKGMSVKDVQMYYDKYYSPSVATLVIVGDVSEGEIIPKLGFLKKWAAKPVTMPVFNIAPAVKSKQPTIYLVDKYKASQSEIRIGRMALPYDYNGKFFKSTVMNYPLGGNFNSRLNLNLREDKGFTYGIRSGFNGTKELGTYTISVSVRSTATDSAIKEINLEVNKFIASGIEQEELDYAKKSLSQSDAMKYETPFDKASFLGQLVNYDLPTGYIEEQNKILNSLTKEELNALAKELLPLDNMIYVVVGDKDKVRAPLEKSGYKVIEYKVD